MKLRACCRRKPPTSLAFTPGGLRRIIRFLQQRFDGGTDIATPIDRALRRIATERWSQADILIVSDGRFPLPSELLRRVAEQRSRRGLRVRGIATGGWSAPGLERLCDSVHRVEVAREKTGYG